MVAEPRYAPDFAIEIDDQPIPARLRASIQSVSLQDGIVGADRVEIQIANENLRWLDDPLLGLDRKLSLSIGYQPDPLTRRFVGEIVSREASFPSSGPPALTVAAQDFLQRTTKGLKSRWFAIPIPMIMKFPLPDIAVAGIVSAENALVPIFDPVGAALSVLLGDLDVATIKDPQDVQKLIRKQAGESDFDFLTRIALENGWDMFIEHSGVLGGYQLRFQSSLDRLSPDVTLRYGASLIEFTPRVSTIGQIAAVTANIWVAEIKTSFAVTVGWDWDRMALTIDIRPALNLIGVGGTGIQEAAIELIEEPLTLASAPRAILSKLVPKLNQRLTGSGSTAGDPRLIAGSVLRLEGLGIEFGGLYRITGTRHTIDGSGYRTSFDVRKEIWFGSVPLPDQGAVAVRVAGASLG